MTRARLAITLLLSAATLAGAAWVAYAPLTAWRLEQRLQQARGASTPADARASLHALLDDDPRQARARLLLAELELRGERREHAYLHYQALTEINPGLADGWLGLARLLASAGLVAEPERALGHALAAEPNHAQARWLRAQLRETLGRLHGARADALRLAGDPRADEMLRRLASSNAPTVNATAAAAQARNERSGSLWPGQLAASVQAVLERTRAQDWSGAAAAAAQAEATYPGTMFGPWLAGIVELSQNRADHAEQHFQRALANNPRSTRVLTILARTWSRQKGALHAADELMKLIERDPGFALPWEIAAHAYLEARQPARAEAALRRGFAWPEAGAVPYRVLAQFYLELDRPADALRSGLDGLSRHPQDLELAATVAQLHARGGNRAEAMRLYQSVLSEAPDRHVDALAFAQLLSVAGATGSERDRALKLASDVAHDAPQDAGTRGAIGKIFLEAGGDAAAAYEQLALAVTAAPNDPALRYQLARTLKASGQNIAARRELERALASPLAFSERVAAQTLLNQLN